MPPFNPYGTGQGTDMVKRSANPLAVAARTLRNFTMKFPARGNGGQWWGATADNHYEEIGNGGESSVVMAPLQWLCRTFPEAPLVVDKLVGQEWEAEKDHDLVSLLRNPNVGYNGSLLWRATVADVVLSGETYWLIDFDNTLKPQAVWWVPASLMEPLSPRDGSVFIEAYRYRPGGEPIILAPAQVVHFRWGLDPEDNRHGASPLRSVMREVFSDDEAGRYTSTILKNMGVPGLILSPDGDYVIDDEDELLATERHITQKFTGRGRGRPMVFGAATKVSQFGFTPQQMDMRTLRRVPEERVSAVLGIPAIVAGLGAGLDRSTFANFAEAREAAYESCVIPLQKLMAEDATNQLLSWYEDTDRARVRFDTSEIRVLQEDENKSVERRLKELNGGAIMLSEYRRDRGLEVDKNMDIYLRPFALTEVRAEDIGKEPEPTPAALDATNPASPLHPDHPDNPVNADAGKPPAQVNGGSKAWTQARLKAAFELQHTLNSRYLKQATHLENQLTPGLLNVFDNLGRQAEAAFVEVGGKSLKADGELAAIAQVVKDIMARINILEQGAKFKDLMTKHYGNTEAMTGEAFNSVFDLGVNLPDHLARAIVDEGGTRAGLVDLEGDTRESLYHALSEGRALGEGPHALARRIRSAVPAGRFVNAGSGYRATLIARTETKYAQNISSLHYYKQAGADMLLAFDAQRGAANSDPVCIARNGRTFTHEEAARELAEEHPNGTLSFAPVFN